MSIRTTQTYPASAFSSEVTTTFSITAADYALQWPTPAKILAVLRTSTLFG
jgi:hypothetical protein